jgi:ubiquinone/menaquinone biosynthesis C-methylase UbiE
MFDDPLFKQLLAEFSRLYWLKPADIVWDAVPAYHIRKFVNEKDRVLDLGCGDGLFSAIAFGAQFPLEYDRFVSAKPENQKIGAGQSGDIYSDPKVATRLVKAPIRQIDVGLELKPHHIKVAKSLGAYEELIEGQFEKIPCEDETFDKVYSAMAFYWGDNLETQLEEVRRVLKTSGEFMVTLISEHMRDMHWAGKIAEENGISSPMKKYLTELDGGRRDFVTRHSGNPEKWKSLLEKHGFETVGFTPVINEIMFLLQDISQRPFLKMFFEMAEREDFQSFRSRAKEYLCNEVYPEFIQEMLRYEGDNNVRHGMYLITAKKL